MALLFFIIIIFSLFAGFWFYALVFGPWLEEKQLSQAFFRLLKLVCGGMVVAGLIAVAIPVFQRIFQKQGLMKARSENTAKAYNLYLASDPGFEYERQAEIFRSALGLKDLRELFFTAPFSPSMAAIISRVISHWPDEPTPESQEVAKLIIRLEQEGNLFVWADHDSQKNFRFYSKYGRISLDHSLSKKIPGLVKSGSPEVKVEWKVDVVDRALYTVSGMDLTKLDCLDLECFSNKSFSTNAIRRRVECNIIITRYNDVVSKWTAEAVEPLFPANSRFLKKEDGVFIVTDLTETKSKAFDAAIRKIPSSELQSKYCPLPDINSFFKKNIYDIGASILLEPFNAQFFYDELRDIYKDNPERDKYIAKKLLEGDAKTAMYSSGPN
ncbi:MAG: hypothetical protein KKD07_07880 [Candidatus Omnitrophica bacterium]|nr:hypothetical protein [Candidatus Omnitrophota bacterium]MBU1997205.1 hypothetical protein [Candidatus Omnitrophota bacterium]MBU4334341.1 hypothetical protein [Candidatus Omnitrophota bacterium]